MFALYSADAWISEFIPDDEISIPSSADDEKFFDKAEDKFLSLYTHDLAPVTATLTPDLHSAT